MFREVEPFSDGFSLLEDDEGIRILLAPDSSLPLRIWKQAKLASVMMVICPNGNAWDHRLLDEKLWHTFDEQLGYIQFRSFLDKRKLDGNFVNVHTHSEFSSLDGLSTIQELVDLAIKYQQPALCITDHGRCAGHTELQTVADKAGIKPIHGIEAYWVENRLIREDQFGYNHLILWAMDDPGLLNLWGASTEANRTGQYRYPRMDWDVLERYNEGLIASTACLRGPITEPILKGNYDLASERLARLMRIFDQRLYVEIHCNNLAPQIEANKVLVAMADQLSLPVIAAVDSHYPCEGDYEAHQLWLRSQMFSKNKGKDNDDSGLFAGRQDYHLMDREEVRSRLDYLSPRVVEEALSNTVLMAERCNAHVPTSSEPPIFSVQYGRSYATNRLRQLCEANWERKIGRKGREAEYRERFEFEMKLLGEKKFHDYYMIVADYVRAAKQAGRLVGPGRGSGAASLVAYLSDITEIDPIEYDLLFARFMTEGRVDPPDFDVDFPSSARHWVDNYIVERWGADNVARVGSHMRLRNKGAFKSMARVLDGISFMDVEAICKIIDEEEASSAGLGYDMERIWQNNEVALTPYRLKYPKLFEMMEKMVGRLSSYGKHAAGVVISTGDPLIGRLPMRTGEDQMVAEFDYRALDAMGLLKFDFLSLRNLDTLEVFQEVIKLVHKNHGLAIDFNSFDEEYHDPQVWDLLCEGRTLGVFQLETKPMTVLAKRMQPRSILDLAMINAIVRPGPKNSGLTETYLRRREGKEVVEYPHPLLEKLLGSSFGCMVYQEQIMGVAQILAGYDDVESDKLRKLLGKKLLQEVEEAGRKFVNACVARNVGISVAQHIWDQMAEYARYSFCKSHSVGYSVLGFWIAWIKTHYPAEFYTACLSTVVQDRVPEFVAEAQQMGFKILPPDINQSGSGFTPSPMTVRYGLLSIKGLGEKAVEVILAHQPYSDFAEFRSQMKGTACNAGSIKTLAAVGAFDLLVPNRKALEIQLIEEYDGNHEICVNKNPQAAAVQINNLPCSFDWSSEPIEFTATGRAKKRKDPPARCTKACRHYNPVGVSTPNVDPYTDQEIRDREMELLGVWLSSTPFDRIAPDDLAQLLDAGALERALPGYYMAAGIIKSIKGIKTKTGDPMGFLSILAQTDVTDLTVFPNEWAKYQKVFRIGDLGIYKLKKNDRGITVSLYVPV